MLKVIRGSLSEELLYIARVAFKRAYTSINMCNLEVLVFASPK